MSAFASRSVAILPVVLLLAVTGRAQANCARPVGFEASVKDNTVVICPQNFAGRQCPDPGGMLRQDTNSGQVVRLPDRCSDQAAGLTDKGCYVDLCVPPGTYRYGFAVPYKCVSSACGTYYFTEQTVTQPLIGCKGDGRAVAPYAAKAPWGRRASICGYLGCGAALGSAPARVLSMQLLVLLLGVALLLRRRTAR